LAGSYLFADNSVKRYIIGIMESDPSHSSERKKFSYQDQTSADLIPIVLNPHVTNDVLEKILNIALQRSSENIDGFDTSNIQLLNALNKKMAARKPERDHNADLAKRVLFLAEEKKLNEAVFDGSDPMAEMRLKVLFDGFNHNNK